MAGFLNKWVYTSISAYSGGMAMCFAIWPSPITCNTYPIASGNHLQWGTTNLASIFVSDFYYPSITGKAVDQRFYFDSGLVAADMTAKYEARKLYCGENALTCLSPFGVASCGAGFYPDLNEQCQSCNSCCSSCTGPGNSACLLCTSECHATAAGTCIRRM